MAEQPETPIPAAPTVPSVPRSNNGGTGEQPGAAAPAPGQPATQTQTEVFFASIRPGPDRPMPESCNGFAKAVLDYEKAVECPVYVLIQNESRSDEMDRISDLLVEELIDSKDQLETGKKIHLILHTLGGDPHAGYKLAIFLQKRTSGFEVVIPVHAKSAGTLITLGATKIIMGDMAELGPLDMQVLDTESDLWDSALNETKTLQTLSREALLLYAEKMEVLQKLYKWKEFATKSKIATEFVNEMIKPLVDKINAVHYTKMARIMEIMKKYGRQLMKRAGYTGKALQSVVDSLGDDYPDHSYVIDSREAKDLGLRVENPKADIAPFIDEMRKICGCVTIVGKVTSSVQ